MKYRQCTLQLLPGTDRPTYAGAKVDVLERLDGHLIVEHEGCIIPTQDAPARPNVLRAVKGHSSHTTLERNGLGGRWETVLASLERERAEESDREVIHRE